MNSGKDNKSVEDFQILSREFLWNFTREGGREAWWTLLKGELFESVDKSVWAWGVEKIQGIEDTWLENSTLLFSCLENEIFLEGRGEGKRWAARHFYHECRMLIED